jgi:hypothetical protein
MINGCLQVQVVLAGSQFATYNESVVESLPSSKRAITSSSSLTTRSNEGPVMIPHVQMTLGSKKRTNTEIVGLNGALYIHHSNDVRTLKAGDRVQVTVMGSVQTQKGAKVTFDGIMDPNLVIIPETARVDGASHQIVMRQDHKLTVEFDDIPGGSQPTPIVVSFDAIAVPNLDGVVPLSNKATFSVNQYTASIPEETPTLSIMGNGRKSIQEHREIRTLVRSTSSSGKSIALVTIGLFSVFTVLALVFAVTLSFRKKKAVERYE